MTRMRTRRLTPAFAISLLSFIAVSSVAQAQTVEVFAIAYGDTVADGVPAPGAGNIEVGGAEDAYAFEAQTGDDAIFDVLAGGAGTFRWRLEAPDGAVVFDSLYVDRRQALCQTGTYTLSVRGATDLLRFFDQFIA